MLQHKVKFHGQSYKINGRVVVCKLRFYTPNGDKRTATAIAICSPEDTFDTKKGKAIARARAEIKARNIFNNILRKYISDYEKELIALKVTLSNNMFYNQHDKDYIKSLVDNGN
jgi:hypothetical protein